MTTLRLLLFFLTLAAVNPALALRCGNKLVTDGDPKAKVEKYCGEPVTIQYRTIYRSGLPRSMTRTDSLPSNQQLNDSEILIHQRSLVEVVVEEWTYNFGPRRLMRMIRFENGLVTKVTQLGYGYLD